jgi:hypothetical protein
MQMAHTLARVALQPRQDPRGHQFVLLEIPLPDLVDRKLVNAAGHPFDPPRS